MISKYNIVIYQGNVKQVLRIVDGHSKDDSGRAANISQFPSPRRYRMIGDEMLGKCEKSCSG